MSDFASRPGVFFILVGPPGAGKNALIYNILKTTPTLQQLATVTTRDPRPTEKQGREHFFVSVPEFQQMIADHALLEWQEVHQGRFYGVPRQKVEEHLTSGQGLIADVDVLGASYIRTLYPENVRLIFVMPPTVETLRERMQIRGETPAEIETRMKRVAMELEYAALCDHVVINDDLDEATAQLAGIIQSETERIRTAAPRERNYRYSVEVIPLYADKVLHPQNAATYSLQGPVQTEESPHQSALKLLETHLQQPTQPDQILRQDTHKGSFIRPAQVRVNENGTDHEVVFTYLYLLPHVVSEPEGWHWMAESELPAPLQKLLQANKLMD